MADRPKAHPLLREDMLHVLGSKPVHWQLFHLGRDRSQQSDLASDQARRLARMKQMLADLHSDVLADAVQWEIPAEYGAGSKRRIWNSDALKFERAQRGYIATRSTPTKRGNRPCETF